MYTKYLYVSLVSLRNNLSNITSTLIKKITFINMGKDLALLGQYLWKTRNNIITIQ